MRAALIHGAGEISVESTPKPSIQNDEVLVKVKVCGICGTDLHTYRTGKDVDGKRPFPVLIDHEFRVARWLKVGSLVKGVAAGGGP